MPVRVAGCGRCSAAPTSAPVPRSPGGEGGINIPSTSTPYGNMSTQHSPWLVHLLRVCSFARSRCLIVIWRTNRLSALNLSGLAYAGRQAGRRSRRDQTGTGRLITLPIILPPPPSLPPPPPPSTLEGRQTTSTQCCSTETSERCIDEPMAHPRLCDTGSRRRQGGGPHSHPHK